ncbi:hypothetical protein D3C86_1940910 [compost metagenome]
MSQHQLSELSRRHAQFFCNCHHAIGLIVAKLYFCGLTNLRFAIRRRTCGNQCLTDFFGEKSLNIHLDTLHFCCGPTTTHTSLRI